jgi:hypothetical protein
MNVAIRSHVLLIVLLLLGTAAHAQDESGRIAAMRFHESRLKRITNYVTTHKELLISDTLVVFAQAADAASSVHCQRLPGCVEQNRLLGKHPNELQTWGAAMGFSGGFITLVHLSQVFASNRVERHLFWGPTAAMCLREVWNVHSNVNEAEFLQHQQAARLRLAQ